MSLSTPIIEVVGRNVVSVDINQPISDAILILAERRFHHLPVVDQGRLAGMISTVDLLKLNGEVLTEAGEQKPAKLVSRIRVGEVMQTEVIPVSERGTVEDAAQLLSSGEYHALPIMAATGELVGIVTTTDLVNYLLESSAKPQLPHEVHERMQLLEKVFVAAQACVSSNMSDEARDALGDAIRNVEWAA